MVSGLPMLIKTSMHTLTQDKLHKKESMNKKDSQTENFSS